ncbi:MAG TPA: gluconate 2-dehydrogenase subunit 3 family protein [Candidatus Binatia bacterium]|jgi:gluconate 2-dehydrogenase gamma chain
MELKSEFRSALKKNEARTLVAIADRIFPPSDSPGAVEAGAVEYIDRALAGDYAELLRGYRKGLRALDRYAREKFGAKFVKLGGSDQDAVLLDCEAGQIPRFKKSADFFATVRCHVLEGVFGEPQYGGNRGLIGWRLVGFPGQQFGYSDAYINKPADLSPVAVEEPAVEEKA